MKRLCAASHGTVRAAALAACALASCGDDDPSARDATTEDAPAAPRDAGPPRCGYSVGFDRPPVDLAACGYCIEPHARIASPHWLGGSRDLQAAATEGGLAIVMNGGDTIASFVTLDGEVRQLLEWPYVEPRPDGDEWVTTSSLVVPVPDGRRVWLHTTFAPQLGLARIAHLALYEVTADGWERVGAVSFPHVFRHDAATSDGHLVGETELVFGDGPKAMMSVSIGSGGTPEVVEDAEPLEGRWITDSWSLADGNVALMLAQNVQVFDAVSGRTRNEPRQWLTVVDSALRVVRDSVRIDVDESPAYVEGMSPEPAGTRVGHRAERLMALRGLQTDAPFTEQYWLQHVTSDGRLRFAPPGVAITPVDAPTWDYPSPTAVPLSPSRDAVIWSDLTAAGVVHYARLVDADGVAVGPVRTIAPTGHGFTREWTIDGAGNSYNFAVIDRPVGERSEPPPGGPAAQPNDHGARFGAARFDEELRSVWDGPIFAQDCQRRFDEGNAALVGAHDEGVWLVWQESQPDPGNGDYVWITKVALIRPDGTFAWGSP